MSRRGSVLSAPYQTPPSAPGADRSHATIRRLSLAATIAALATIALGATVRATGSGDACPDWPRCFGRWIPPLEYHALIEYAHRLATPLLTGLIGGLALVAWRRYRRVRSVLWLATAAIGLLFVQAGLGAIVVTSNLHAGLVTLHLATAMTLVGVLVHTTVSAWSLGRSRRPAPRLSRTAWLVAAGVLAVILAGAFVRGEGASLAFRDWPLMDGRPIPAVSDAAEAAHAVHRLLALGLVATFPVLLVRSRRVRPVRPGPAAFATAGFVALLGQVVVGAANVWSGLSPPAVVAHVVLSTLVWAFTIAAAASVPVMSAREAR